MATFRNICYITILLLLDNVYGLSSGPASFDCPMRDLVLEYAQYIQPFLTKDKLQQVADALNGDPINQNCTVSINNLPYSPPLTKPKTYSTSIDTIPTIFIDPIHGNDGETITTNHSSINKPFKTIQSGLDYMRLNFNNSQKRQILLREGIHYLQDTLYFDSNDSNLKISSYNSEDAIITGAIPLNNLNWKLYRKSKNNDGKDIYSTIIPSDINITEIVGLRVNSTRAIRCRYPNGNPEIYPPGFGTPLTAQSWYGANKNAKPYYVYNPSSPTRDDNPENAFTNYKLGIGGTSCYMYEPQVGFWCAGKHQIPTGLIYNAKDLPNAPYKNPQKGVIQAWRHGHWASWMFEISEYNGNTQNISFSKGGFQGARGGTAGQGYFVENIFEELDYENEWFYNESTRTLYYKMNVSNESPNSANLVFEATKLKVLMNYTGTMEHPVENIEISDMTFRDTAITYLDPHGMPSGGDWSLQRTGSIYLDGCKNFSIYDNVFIRLDNIGINMNRYNRYHQIFKNEFVFLGGSAVTTWGDTVSNNKSVPLGFGYDGTTGIQPRFINISFNFGHELGIWEKQSTFYFQGKSCQNYVENNIIFNGPRSGVNINDGFGGRTLIKKNIIFNTCRESGSHGPINSWDRQPYLTKVRYLNGTATMDKGYDNFTQNILVSNYLANFILDGDDGARNWYAYKNLFVYGLHGTKSTKGGHSIKHFDNYYGYLATDCLMSNYAGDAQGQYAGDNDWYFNNTCIIAANKSKSMPVLNWGSFACQTKQNQWPILGNNTIYAIMDNVTDVGLCNYTESKFQSQFNTDIDTKVLKATDDSNKEFIRNAKVMLFSS